MASYDAVTELGLSDAENVGEDKPITLKRWVFKWATPPLIAAVLFVWTLDARVQKLEQTPSSSAQLEERIRQEEERTRRIEQVLVTYEDLRMQRERQIAELQTELRYSKIVIDQMNAKIDRLIEARFR